MIKVNFQVKYVLLTIKLIPTVFSASSRNEVSSQNQIPS